MNLSYRFSVSCLLLALVFSAGGCVTPEGADSVKQASAANKQTAPQIDPKVEKFLVNAADARMMDRAEGEVAVARGTTDDVRAYGKKMIDEQTVLLKQLQEQADKLKITLPQEIGAAKRDGLADLSKQMGADVDAKFIKMITIDHKRDVREFEKASQFENADVSAFAKQTLPTIQRHLAEIEAIHESHEKAK